MENGNNGKGEERGETMRWSGVTKEERRITEGREKKEGRLEVIVSAHGRTKNAREGGEESKRNEKKKKYAQLGKKKVREEVNCKV